MVRQAKPGSKAYRNQLRDRLTALGFPDEAVHTRVAECLIAECHVRPRIAWRLASELSLDRAARRYNSVQGDPRAGMRGSRIWEYEQWPDRGVRPTLGALRILAQVYHTDWRSLLDLRDLERLPPRDLAEYHAGGDSWALATTSEPAGTGTPAPPPAVVDEEGNPLAQAVSLTAMNVDDTQLEALWADLNTIGNASAHATSDSVLRRLSLVRERLVTLLRGRQRLRQTRDLHMMAAKCCAVAASVSADLARYGAAHELNSAAWLYSQFADDSLARRWVRATQSRVEYWAGNGVESAWLAADGSTYRSGDTMTEATLILEEARGWASLQAERQALDAIGRWARIEDTLPTVADEDGFFHLSIDRRHYLAGTSLLSVGRTHLALRELRTARDAYRVLAPEYRWTVLEPMLGIDIGRTYLRLGDLDGTVAELEPVLSLDVGRLPHMVRVTLNVLAGELTEHRWRGSKAARGLVDAILETHALV